MAEQRVFPGAFPKELNDIERGLNADCDRRRRPGIVSGHCERERMIKPNYSYAKRQRELAKKAKKEEKRKRKEEARKK